MHLSGKSVKSMAMKYWLMKSEPEDYSIDDFKKEKKTLWTGIRNYQARNFMTQEMQKGDQVIFYHSNATPPGIAGLGEVSSDKAVPDPLQFDKKSQYFEKRASKDKVVWECVELKFKEKFKTFVSLQELKDEKSLQEMRLLQRGNRLSILPLKKSEFNKLVKMASNPK